MILFLIAYILLLPMTIINYFVAKKDGYFRNTALNIDIFANREFRATWNLVFRNDLGYKFGKEGETISSALGKNQRDETLTKTGKAVCWILDKIDKDHCKNSIKE